MLPDLLVCFVALVTSAVLTWLVRRVMLSQGLLDIPNQRSSHSVPTPRGGGAAIVASVSAAVVVLGMLGMLELRLAAALVGGGLAVAAVGFVDDRYSIAAGTRLVIHIGAAIWAVAWIGGLPPLQVGARVIDLGWPGHALAVLGIVWTLNLFNFMDGIDGIAASEAVFVSAAGAIVGVADPGSSEVARVALPFAAACAGFLLWNWPPAKIFMGDVGSGYLGYAIAVLTLAAARADPAAVWVWLILGGVFFVDSTVTLIRRGTRGERLFAAHRSHAYQWLARRWASHLRVTAATVLLNVLWLLPCALTARNHPKFAAWMALIALTPLGLLAIVCGSGRQERDPA